MQGAAGEQTLRNMARVSFAARSGAGQYPPGQTEREIAQTSLHQSLVQSQHSIGHGDVMPVSPADMPVLCCTPS